MVLEIFSLASHMYATKIVPENLAMSQTSPREISVSSFSCFSSIP